LSRILVDTHVLLWWLLDDPALSATARRSIADPAHEVLVSAVSVWEVAIKQSRGRLEVRDDLTGAVERAGFEWLPITPRHAWEVRSLPLHHRDPFDRLLIAQARAEGASVVTADVHFSAYDVPVTW
jgi:PIN domain nuclease of toxin-antitoxin system